MVEQDLDAYLIDQKLRCEISESTSGTVYQQRVVSSCLVVPKLVGFQTVVVMPLCHYAIMTYLHLYLSHFFLMQNIHYL